MKSFTCLLASSLAFLCFNAYAQNISRVHTVLDSMEKNLGLSGVVLVSKGDQVLLHKGFGFSDRDSRVNTDPNTIYHIASVTKSFTGIAILKLVEQGKLGLQDSIGKYFTNIPSEKSGISIHQLLIHKSGIPQTYAAEGERDQDKAARNVLKERMEGLPGEKFIYSNGNYTLLAIIIEKVSGIKWETFIREAILVPLDMGNTFFWEEKNETNWPEAAPNQKVKKRTRDYGFLGSTGIFSTAPDLHKFQKALKSDIILKDSTRALLLRKQVKLKSAIPGNTDYSSYGWFQTEGELNSIWSRGNEEAWGVTLMHWLHERDLSVIVLSNKEKLANGEKQHIFTSQEIIKLIK